MRFTLVALLLISGLPGSSQNLLAIPDTLSGTVFNLNIAPGTRNFYSGFTTNTIGINGDYLGPTLMLRQGDFITINVNNNLTDTTTLHWHGMHVPAIADGGPHITITPGTTWSPSFEVKDKASLHWYHSHLHMRTAEHVTKGASGLIYVRDTEEDSLSLPRNYGIDDIPLVVQTRAFDPAKQFLVESAADSVVVINGTMDPFILLPAQVIRLRILNAATERSFNFGFSNNSLFYQIGSDGGLLSAPVSMTRLLLSPGERAEILVDLSALNGQVFSLMSFASQIPAGIYGAQNPQGAGPNLITGYAANLLNGNDYDLLQINVVPPNSNPVTVIPSSLSIVQPYLESAANKTRDFIFSPEVMGPTGSLLGPFVINMMSFDMMMINDTVRLNDIEVWQLTNQTRISHPFHIHDVQFYILDINGVAPSPGMAGRKDVVLVPPLGGTVRFIAKFEDYADPVFPYMYHCHMLTHEDGGMMGQFIVVDSSTGLPENEKGFFNVYPNPVVSGQITLTWNENTGSDITLTVFDITGKELEKIEIRETTSSVFTLPVHDFPSGIYILKLESESGSYYDKIIVDN